MKLIIDWLVFHPEAFIVFWAVVIALLAYVLLSERSEG